MTRSIWNIIRQRQGSALILAISLVTLLSIVALGYGAFAATEFHMGVNDIEDLQAMYAAEAGISQATAELSQHEIKGSERLKAQENGNHYLFDSEPMSTEVVDPIIIEDSAGDEVGRVSVELFRNQLDITIKASGSYRDTVRVIEARVQNKNGTSATPFSEGYKILSWREY